MVSRQRQYRCRRTITRFRPLGLRTNIDPPLFVPLAASPAFSDSTASQRNQLVADLIAAEAAREGAVMGSTHEDGSRAWKRFSLYLDSIGLSNNTFLDSFTRPQPNKIIGCLAMAMREGRFSHRSHGTLACGTVRNTISSVSQTFREHGRPNPTNDEDLWQLKSTLRHFRF